MSSATVEKTQNSYFKLQGSQGLTHYSTGTNCTLGKDGKVRLPLRCSRKHARIHFKERNGWVLECLSKNGCYLDGVSMRQGEVKLLKSKSLMQLGENLIYFLLPTSSKSGLCQVTTERLRNPFSRAEREKFRKSVLRWGVMRLSKLKTDFPKRSLAEMNYYRKTFLSLVIFYSGQGKWESVLKDMMKQITTDRKISTFDKNLNSWLTLARHSSTFAGKLMLLERIRRGVHKFESESLNVKIELKEKAHKPATWWINGQHDADLLMGIHQFGYGEWEQIRKHMSLSFHNLDPKIKWPKTNALVARLNKIVNWIEKKDLSESSQSASEGGIASAKSPEVGTKREASSSNLPDAKRAKVTSPAKSTVDVAQSTTPKNPIIKLVSSATFQEVT